jgi:hypothetical protein
MPEDWSRDDTELMEEYKNRAAFQLAARYRNEYDDLQAEHRRNIMQERQARAKQKKRD